MPEDVIASSGRLSVLSDLKGVEIFVAVVETRSLTRIAQKLGIARSTVSKEVAELEERSKVRLTQGRHHRGRHGLL